MHFRNTQCRLYRVCNAVRLRELPGCGRGPGFRFTLPVTPFRRGDVTDVSPLLMTTLPGQVFEPWSTSNSADGATKHLLYARTFELRVPCKKISEMKTECPVSNEEFFCLSVSLLSDLWMRSRGSENKSTTTRVTLILINKLTRICTDG